MPSRGRLIVSGILFWYPLAGVTYQFLHYLIGLRRLGWDPYYVETSGRWIFDPELNDISGDAGPNVRRVAAVLEAYGLGDRWAFRGEYPGGEAYGLSDLTLRQLYRDADAFLNVTASQEIREEHLACRRRVYVESDPFAAQIRVAQNDPKTITELAAHDTHFSFGENLGAPDCTVPVERFRWLPTRQPVVLDLWDQPHDGRASAYTTITTWRNRGKDITYEGETYYWTKDREFMKVIDLPRLRPVRFAPAVWYDGDAQAVLERHGWACTDARDVSGHVDAYRAFIRGSRAEFTVTKDQVVRPRTGWFSDRSACYLAAGRPVITQDTGFGKVLPTGKGLHAFSTRDDILAALDAVETDYEGNCVAARDIAAEYFAAEKVLGSLLARADL
jgi:hypothetical protein